MHPFSLLILGLSLSRWTLSSSSIPTPPFELDTQALSVPLNGIHFPLDVISGTRMRRTLYGTLRTSGSSFEAAEKAVEGILERERRTFEGEASELNFFFFPTQGVRARILAKSLEVDLDAFHFLHSRTGALIIVLNTRRLRSEKERRAAAEHEAWEYTYEGHWMLQTSRVRRRAHRLACATENIHGAEPDGLTARHIRELREMPLSQVEALLAEHEEGSRRKEIEELLPAHLSTEDVSAAIAYEDRFVLALKAQKVFRDLIMILEEMTGQAPLPATHPTQKKLAQDMMPRLQRWYELHREPLETLQAHLADPQGAEQYKRNLIYRDPAGRFVILNHRFRGGTPVHFHGTEADGYKMAFTLPIEDGLREQLFSGEKESGQPWATLRPGAIHEARKGHLDYLTVFRGTPHRIFNARMDGQTVGILEIYFPAPKAFERAIPLEEIPNRYYVVGISSLEFPFRLADLTQLQGWDLVPRNDALVRLSMLSQRNNENLIVYRANETVTRVERALQLLEADPTALLYIHPATRRYLLKLSNDSDPTPPARNALIDRSA